MSTTPNLNPQDRKDLDKFTKYLVYKCVQIIVQSRSGEKTNTQSKLFSSGSDWFNLSIRDDPNVVVQIRDVYAGGSITNGKKICLDVSLTTMEGEEMLLETWDIEMNETCDPTSRVLHSVYGRIGLLLKTLVATSRALPAYRLSRRQCPDSYAIRHDIYVGQARSAAGDGYIRRIVGLVPTPVGTVALSVAYRTRFVLSPKQRRAANDSMQDFRDDHYRQDSFSAANASAREFFSCTSQAFYETEQLVDDDSPDHGATATLPAATLHTADEQHIITSEGLSTARQMSLPVKGVELSGNIASRPESSILTQSPNSPHDSTTSPTGVVCQCSSDDRDKNERNPEEESSGTGDGRNIFPMQSSDKSSEELRRSLQPMVVASSSSASDYNSPGGEMVPDDFVVLDGRTPLAGGPELEEIGNFYEECKVAPPLSMFQQSTDLHEMLNSITDQLAQFEANAKDFDEFVNSITEEKED